MILYSGLKVTIRIMIVYTINDSISTKARIPMI